MKMKVNWIILIIRFVFGTLLVSCEDVINVTLKDVTPQLVIEGSISNLSDSVIIFLHKTTDYYKPTEIGSVNDAEVKVTDSEGIPHNLPIMADGIYCAGDLQGKPGDMFGLEVNEGGVKYVANCRMPMLVPVEAVIIDKDPDMTDEDRINILINDPAGIANYYQVDLFMNGMHLNTGNHFILFSDKYFDGKPTYLMVSGQRLGITSFKRGDLIRVRMKNIEKSMYNYLDILRSITEDDQILPATTPSNPPNNLTGGALGYFAAWSISEKTVIKY